MALLHMDGFDTYADAAALATGGFYSTVTSLFLSNGGRFGGGALNPNGNKSWVDRNVTPGSTTLWTGFAYRYETGSATGYTTLGVWFYSTIGIETVFGLRGSDGVVALLRGSTVLASGPSTLKDGAWHWIEVKNTFSSTAGAMELWIDGVQTLTVSGVSTRSNASATGISAVRIGCDVSATSFRVDDWYILDTSGAAPNARLGDSRITTLVPTNDASPNQGVPSGGTAHFALADELPFNASDYLTLDNTVGYEERFGISALPYDPTAIHAVQVRACAWKSDAGAANAKVGVVSGAAQASGAAAPLLTTALAQISGTFVVNPDGGAAWTKPALSAAKINFVVSA